MGSQKLYGLTGKILRVNLSENKLSIESTPERVFREYIGGRGVGAYLLLKELQPGVEPLGSGNKLVFSTGPLTGTLTPGASRAVVCFRSPMSETYSYSLCGGHFPVELKFAGYDILIIEGKSETPVYLWIDNDKVELRDASMYWGLTTHQTEDNIRKDVKDTEVHIACIGPAGEKLVRFACIQSDYHREFGRGGAGAVMGSKNLKAIVVRGSLNIAAADSTALKQYVKDTYQDFRENPKAKLRRAFGTAEMVDGTNKMGYWGTRNFTTGYFEEAPKVNADSFKKDYFAGSLSCYGCPIACGKVSKLKNGKLKDITIEGPEFETIGLLGANCGISDPEAIIKATEICDLYGIDTMSAGATVSMAMECFEQNLISTADTGGINLSFGNGEALIATLKQIVLREGIGDILAEGAKRAANKFGVSDLAMQVKGMEFATYEPRGAKGMGLSYAVCSKGGHHMFAPTMGAETSGDGSQRFVNEGKAALVRQTQAQMAIVDSLVLCSSMRFVMSITDQMNYIKAVTGWDISPEQALEIGERIVNLERLFNIREGFSRKDDTLPKRITDELMPTGSAKGQRVDLIPILDEYYEIMGWDHCGCPSQDLLKKLGLQEFGLI